MRSLKVLFLVVAVFLPLTSALAEPEYTTFNTARFTLYFDKGDPSPALIVEDLAGKAITILNSTSDEYGGLFGKKPSNKVILRFLSPDEFKRQTGAPEWTSAMFYRGEISIPLHRHRGLNENELNRALRHEYTHAVIAELSDYRCPAWLDEGVAQLLEGQVNPLLGPALRNWIKDNEAMPLSWLVDGFMVMDEKVVPAAYAQSLFAARELVANHGYSAIVNYLTKMRDGVREEDAFLLAFKSEKRQFEELLTKQIREWARTAEINP